jgi:hypothetical protein
MRTILLAASFLLCVAAFAADQGARDTRFPQLAKKPPTRVEGAPAQMTRPADKTEATPAFEPVLWLPGDSGLDYLARCAAGCNG